MSSRPARVSPTALNALIQVEQRLEPCWRVRKYLGSMLTFDFGARLIGQGRRGPYEIGSSTLGVRNCQWTFDSPTASTDSELAGGHTGELLTRALDGAHLSSCERRQMRLAFGFSNAASLSLDLTNLYGNEPGDPLASIQLSGGAYFELKPDGRFELIVGWSIRDRQEVAA